MSKEPEVIHPKEAAAILRIHYRTMIQILRSGRGPAFARFGKAIRIDAEDFKRWRRNGTNGHSIRKRA